ncbi:hypothetical protein F5Y10DRAFT_95922 [Nemania abortiva]|nr:hypothetical protein F5Y10DRAFT_95922 [Nemania abortiva]
MKEGRRWTKKAREWTLVCFMRFSIYRSLSCQSCCWRYIHINVHAHVRSSTRIHICIYRVIQRHRNHNQQLQLRPQLQTCTYPHWHFSSDQIEIIWCIRTDTGGFCGTEQRGQGEGEAYNGRNRR